MVIRVVDVLVGPAARYRIAVVLADFFLAVQSSLEVFESGS